MQIACKPPINNVFIDNNDKTWIYDTIPCPTRQLHDTASGTGPVDCSNVANHDKNSEHCSLYGPC